VVVLYLYEHPLPERELTVKGFQKLKNLLSPSVATLNAQMIPLLWRCSSSDMGFILSATNRGTLLQNWLHEYHYRALGFINTDIYASNYKAIDLYHLGQKFGISIKTTTTVLKSELKGLLKKNIDDILTNGSVTWEQQTLHCDQIKLQVVVPSENVDAVKPLLQEIFSDLGIINPNFGYEVISAESLLVH
jgi:hypothetical protein